MTCRILMVVCCLVLGSSSLAAQRAALRPRPSSLFEPPPSVAADTLHLKPTYWKEGALIGGGIGAAFGVYLGLEFCRYEDTDCATGVLAGGVLFALFTAIPGALIGGQFDKAK